MTLADFLECFGVFRTALAKAHGSPLDLAPYRDLLIEAWDIDPDDLPGDTLDARWDTLDDIGDEPGALAQSLMWLTHIDDRFDVEGMAVCQPIPREEQLRAPFLSVVEAVLACSPDCSEARHFESMPTALVRS